MTRALIHLPPAVKPGDVIEVRTTLGHPMETGLRLDGDGRKVPQDIVRRFTCAYNGEPVFECELFIAIAANPYIAFPLRAERSGTLRLQWTGDNGFSHTEVVALAVT
jgi:sulfur-oxidizing protein SoxZ